MVLSTRREILSAFFGAAWGSQLACKSTERAEYEGAFVDADFRHGHLLRKGLKATPQGPFTETSVAIIGGGISGLTAAWRLKQLGQHNFQLYDLEQKLGGTSVGGTRDSLNYPWGAHYVPAPRADNIHLTGLLSEMGVAQQTPQGLKFAEHILCASPQERLYHEGAWYPGIYPRIGASPEDLKQKQRFEARIDSILAEDLKVGGRSFALPTQLSRQSPFSADLDKLSFAQWLNKEGFDSPRLRWYCEYGTKDDFGARLEDTSAWYGLHYFAARKHGPGQGSAEFLTWPEGNYRVVQHLQQKLPQERLHGGQMLVQIVPQEQGALLGIMDTSSESIHWIKAQRVLCAFPRFLRPYLFKNYPEVPQEVPDYSPWLVANIHLSGRPKYLGCEVAWDNVIYQSASLGYVVSTHQGGRAHGPTVWTYYLPLIGSDVKAERHKLLALDYRQAADLVLSELARVHRGFLPLVKRVDLRRWGHGMVRPRPGSRQQVLSGRYQASVSPFHFAHTDLSQVALIEEAVAHACRAAEEVQQALSRGT